VRAKWDIDELTGTKRSHSGCPSFGGPASWTFGNGQAVTITRDLDYRITGIRSQAGTKVALDLVPGWDTVDNLATLVDLQTPANDQTFAYTSLDRLKSATGTYGSQGWTYDKTGNRLTRTSNGTTYTSTIGTTSNRLTAEPTDAVTYTHDANGHRLTRTQAGVTRRVQPRFRRRFGQEAERLIESINSACRGHGCLRQAIGDRSVFQLSARHLPPDGRARWRGARPCLPEIAGSDFRNAAAGAQDVRRRKRTPSSRSPVRRARVVAGMARSHSARVAGMARFP
jgi:hypothetical protein